MDRSGSVLKVDDTRFQQLIHVARQIPKITERVGVLPGETKWFECAIETDYSHPASRPGGLGDDRQRVCSATQTHIPDHKLSRFLAHPIAKFELANVKRLGFGGGSNDRMECFALGERANAPFAVLELDQMKKWNVSHHPRKPDGVVAVERVS